MPHEVDMTRALIIALREWQADHPHAQPIRRVTLGVGQFTCVEPELLRTSFAQQKSGTFLAAAELIIHNIPFIAYCCTCQQEYRPALGLRYACPTCNAPLHEIRSGRELKIEHVEWASDTQPA